MGKRGRPTKLTEELKPKLEKLYRSGFIDEDVAEIIGVTRQTIDNWKKADPGFFAALKEWKVKADGKVELSLYERACGYSHPETKAQWVQDENGGRWEYAELTKHYPPDPVSMIFWLKNRQPARWRDKQNVEHSIDPEIIDALFSGLDNEARGRFIRKLQAHLARRDVARGIEPPRESGA